MNIKPVGNRVLVELSKVEEKTKSGILLPNSSNTTTSNTGIIVAIGNISEDIKIGDKVFFKPHSGTKITETSKKLLILEVEEILAILN
jgi:chaperonin GroES